MENSADWAFEAVIFDLDGVITRTAATHFAAWKKMFDGYLQHSTKENGEPFREFTRKDYLSYVDGKPRYEGVASFLESRGIQLPWGTPGDAPVKETICGLGNKKNDFFVDVLAKEGAEVFPSTVRLIRALEGAGIKLGVASSSKNCKAILEAVHLQDTFGARVDGVVSEKQGLKGKPEPDIFTTACEMLGVSPSKSVVVEDVVSGVQAGEKGEFGLVLGIARTKNGDELLGNGAGAVVSDLEEINGVEGLNQLFLEHQEEIS